MIERLVRSRRLKVDARELAKGFVWVMNWSPQCSPQALSSPRRYLPVSTADSIALFSNMYPEQFHPAQMESEQLSDRHEYSSLSFTT